MDNIVGPACIRQYCYVVIVLGAAPRPYVMFERRKLSIKWRINGYNVGNIVNGQVYGRGNGLGIFLDIFLIKRNPQYFTITIRTCFFRL